MGYQSFIIYIVKLLCLFTTTCPIHTSKQLNEAILCSPVLFKSVEGQCSGVFVSDSTNIYFITARHCLFVDPEDGDFDLIANKGELIYYPHDVSKDDQSIITVDIKRAFNEGMIKYDMQQDVAVILIAKITDATNFKLLKFCTINKGNIFFHHLDVKCTLSYDKTSIGGEIYLYGYPVSIGRHKPPQFDYLRPLLRKGIVAGKYEKLKTLIIDCPAYYGNSGGPVFATKDSSTTLVGILSEYVPYGEGQNTRNWETNTQTMNSGYSVVISIDYALDLIKKFKH
jgi:hypothetical protein